MEVSLQQELLATGTILRETGRSIQVEGRLTLPAGSPSLESVQSCRVRIRDLRSTAAAECIRVEGLAEVELNYLAREGETEGDYLAVWSKESGGALAFSGEVPLAGAQPGMDAEAEAAVAAIVAESADGATVYCQITLEVAVQAERKRQIRVTADLAPAPPGLEVVKETLQIEEQTAKAESTVAVDSVLALPEVKPDLVRILAKNARVTGIATDLVRGRAIVTGRLELKAVYAARSEEGAQSIETCEWGGEGRIPLAFEAFIDLSPPGPNAAVESWSAIDRLSLEPIGPREVKLEATVRVTVKATEIKSVPVVVDLIPGPDEVIDAQWIQFECLNVLGRAQQELEIETTLEIPPGKPAAERILQAIVVPRSFTAQAAEGKCLIDGWLDLNLLYLPEEHAGGMVGLNWARSQGTGIPVADVVEITEARPDLEAQIEWRLGRVNVEQTGSRTLRINAILPVRVKVVEHKAIAAVADAAVVPLAPIPGRPSMLFYVVQPGDSLWGIARRYQTTVEALARTNKVADQQTPQAGTKLLIPKSPVAV